MFLSLSARTAGTILALALAACSAAAPAAPESPAPAPGIVVTYHSPTVSVNSPSPTASGAPSPSPVAPSPSPTPRRVESAHFYLTMPVGWTVEAQIETPEGLSLRGPDGQATFTVSTTGGEPVLSKRRAEAVKEAGIGILTNTPITVDEVAGYYVTSNRDTPDGRRYVAEYGFIYREKVVLLQGRWDKRATNTDAIAKDVQAIVKSFRWI